MMLRGVGRQGQTTGPPEGGMTGGWELITAEGWAVWRKAKAERHSQLSGLKQHIDFYCNGNLKSQ